MLKSKLKVAISHGASKGELELANVSETTIKVALRTVETIVKMVVVSGLIISILWWLNELATKYQF
jgi:hypothetical protein